MTNTKNIPGYAAKIAQQLSGIFEPESPNFIDMKTLEDPLEFQHFMYALSTLVPCSVYNQATNGSVDVLQFNHMTNALIFAYAANQEAQESTVETDRQDGVSDEGDSQV
jgi:hypothetical protein